LLESPESLEREAPALHLLLLAAAVAGLLEMERPPAPAGDRPLLLLPAFWRGASGELDHERAAACARGTGCGIARFRERSILVDWALGLKSIIEMYKCNQYITC
jgi:hypothetical protein